MAGNPSDNADKLGIMLELLLRRMTGNETQYDNLLGGRNAQIQNPPANYSPYRLPGFEERVTTPLSQEMQILDLLRKQGLPSLNTERMR